MPLIERIIQFTGKYRLAAHLIYWMSVTLFASTRYAVRDMDPITIAQLMYFFSLGLFDIWIIAPTTYFLAYFVLPRLLTGKHYYRTIITSLVALYLLTVLSRLSVVYLLEPLVRRRPFSQESVPEIFTDLGSLFFNYFFQAFSFASVFIFIKLLIDQYVVNKRAMELEKQKTDIELRALKAQLNPHFLFNTLNNIYSLSILQSPKTSPSIARLSEILDTLLYRSGKMYVPVSQEITLLQNYIELEKLRYDERLVISFEHQMEREVAIAPLILLSLTENAFKHGAGEDAGSPEIRIVLKQTGDRFSFEISNTFREKVDQQLGIGLENIRQQLALLYPETHTFETTAAQRVFTAKLELHLNQQV
ncbi:sensor histidine kinase [Chitinophaga varians]|uniref:sensor histidine kinase n=1 Tax=Chitinophaga varians TaxID=2202339 RepID=UPI00165FFCF3|nr:histidine kinase [Chitinophaga varians]MBC9909895.1 histidine kinase [Chitinophaga varians]